MLGYPVTTRPCIAEYLLQRMQEMGKKKGPAVIEALGKGTTRKLISIDNLVTASEKQGLGYASTLVNHVLDQVSFTLHCTCTKAVHVHSRRLVHRNVGFGYRRTNAISASTTVLVSRRLDSIASGRTTQLGAKVP